MEWLVVLVGMGAAGFWFLNGPLKRIRMGQHLTRMTNIMAEVEAIGGPDNLSPDRERELDRALEDGIAYLRTFPPHVVTRELAKNAVLAERVGRPLRTAAIERLLDNLSRTGVALDMDEYLLPFRLGLGDIHGR